MPPDAANATTALLKAGGRVATDHFHLCAVLLRRLDTGGGNHQAKRRPGSSGWRPFPIIYLDGGSHAGRKDDVRRHLIDMHTK